MTLCLHSLLVKSEIEPPDSRVGDPNDIKLLRHQSGSNARTYLSLCLRTFFSSLNILVLTLRTPRSNWW